MRIYFILFCCSFSFFGTTQSLDTNEKRDKILSDSGYYRTFEDSISNIKKEDRIRYGVSINQSFTRYGLPTAVLFTIQFKKHQFDLGPQFRLGKSINESQKNIGLEFNYRFYVTGDTKSFSSYALFNADYFYQFKKENRTIVSSDPLLNGQLSTRINKYNDFQLNLGYGIKFKLIEGLYIGSHIGGGFYRENGSNENIVLGNSIKNNSKETGIGFIGTVYIGYKF